MNNKFLDGMENILNVTQTQNGDKAYRTTKSDVLDLFYQGGASDRMSEEEVIRMIDLAMSESKELALRVLLYLVDIRKGQGKRKMFKTVLKHFNVRYPDILINLVKYVPEFGRWDYLEDLIIPVGTTVKKVEDKNFYVLLGNVLKPISVEVYPDRMVISEIDAAVTVNESARIKVLEDISFSGLPSDFYLKVRYLLMKEESKDLISEEYAPLLNIRVESLLRNSEKYKGSYILETLKRESEYIRFPLFNTTVTMINGSDEITEVEKAVLEVIAREWFKTFKKGDSLLYKWLYTTRQKDRIKRRKSEKIRRYLEQNKNKLSLVKYNRIITTNRSKLNIIEKNLTNKTYDKIDYSKVPSKATLKYISSFYRNDEERFTKHLELVKEGKTKVNSAVTYPYEIIHQYKEHSRNTVNDAYEELWKALPNYMTEARNILPVVDVSGSMECSVNGNTKATCMDAAVALGIYTAERNVGAFKDHFITFSTQPRLQKLKGDTLFEKYHNMERAHWSMSTSIERVMYLILQTAVVNHLSPEELPDTIIIFSDMQFNSSMDDANRDKSVMESYRDKFTIAGYKFPNVVYWNLNGSYGNSPATARDSGIMLVSGLSPVILTSVLNGTFSSPYDLMMDVISNERYNVIEDILK